MRDDGLVRYLDCSLPTSLLLGSLGFRDEGLGFRDEGLGFDISRLEWRPECGCRAGKSADEACDANPERDTYEYQCRRIHNL